MQVSSVTKPGREEVQRCARELGFQLVHFCSAARLQERFSLHQGISAISQELPTLIVLAMKSPLGLPWARHAGTKQFWAGRILKRIDEACMKLVCLLERYGGKALVVSSLSIDFDQNDSTDLSPAGQGSWLLRAAAVVSGMGSWGLNQMVLTPEFGPRIFLGGVLSDQQWEPHEPLGTELCLGLEQCGRCAAICPEDAIPRRARVGSSLSDTRGLNAEACARSSQVYGLPTFRSHLTEIFQQRAAGPDALWNSIKKRTTGELWQTMIMMKEGAFMGCAECVQVCPVGQDYEAVQRSPHRSQDLPEGVKRSVNNGFVQIEHSPSRKKTTEPRP